MGGSVKARLVRKNVIIHVNVMNHILWGIKKLFYSIVESFFFFFSISIWIYM